jgi:pimeloyl-ACP methyl ester carboxylesterase
MRKLLLLLLMVSSGCIGQPPISPRDECVVLLHGLGRSAASMSWLEQRLATAGFQVANLDYPSEAYPIETLAENLAGPIGQACGGTADKLHLVGHSLGGILIRLYLQQHHPTNLGRVVMLSPPNQGSELADRLRDNPVYRLATGPAGQQLGTAPDSLPNRLGPVDFDLGVITGNTSLNPLYSSWIPGEDDGKVAVARAGVSGMADLLVVAHSHTWIMNSAEVADQIVYFLAHGYFRRDWQKPE